MTDDVTAWRGPFAGRPGHLDAPYLPTPPEVVEAMLDLAGLMPGEHLVDLGCGDGRIVVAAARRGATALGVDVDPHRVAEAVQAVRAAGLTQRASVRQGDLFATSLAGADVVTLYLLAHVNEWLQGKLLAGLRPGARVVSHNFPMRDWEPAATHRFGDSTLHLWVVPDA